MTVLLAKVKMFLNIRKYIVSEFFLTNSFSWELFSLWKPVVSFEEHCFLDSWPRLSLPFLAFVWLNVSIKLRHSSSVGKHCIQFQFLVPLLHVLPSISPWCHQKALQCLKDLCLIHTVPLSLPFPHYYFF